MGDYALAVEIEAAYSASLFVDEMEAVFDRFVTNGDVDSPQEAHEYYDVLTEYRAGKQGAVNTLNQANKRLAGLLEGEYRHDVRDTVDQLEGETVTVETPDQGTVQRELGYDPAAKQFFNEFDDHTDVDLVLLADTPSTMVSSYLPDGLQSPFYSPAFGVDEEERINGDIEIHVDGTHLDHPDDAAPKETILNHLWDEDEYEATAVVDDSLASRRVLNRCDTPIFRLKHPGYASRERVDAEQEKSWRVIDADDPGDFLEAVIAELRTHDFPL